MREKGGGGGNRFTQLAYPNDWIPEEHKNELVSELDEIKLLNRFIHAVR